MLSFFYSTQNINEFQKNPTESIGGYISLNQFESGELNNIIQQIGQMNAPTMRHELPNILKNSIPSKI